MATPTIRSARPEDIDALVGAYQWLFDPPGSRPALWDADRAAAALAHAIGSDSASVFLAEDSGELIGFCTAYEDIESVRFGRRVWVEDLAVTPAQRSLGVGKRLLDAAKQWARGRGASHLELDSSEVRIDAHRFYEREAPSWRSVSYGWQL